MHLKGIKRYILTIIGENIKKARTDSGLTRNDLSSRFSTAESYIRGVENGQKDLSLYRLVEIADFLGVPVSSLLEGI